MKLKLKPTWILLLIGAVLLLVVFGTQREMFNPATERPSTSDPSIRATIKSYAGISDDTDPRIATYIALIQKYYDTKFLPEKTSNSMKVAQFVNEQQDATIDKPILTRILDYIFLTTDTTGTTAPAGPTGTTASSTPSSPTGPTGTSAPSTPSTPSGPTGPAPAPSSSQFSQRIWGPPFVGVGGPGTGNGTDSTKNTPYPQLLGGNASQYKGGDGSKIQFPSLGSLGLNADANFFPFSRSPGDMDLIADPFRVSQTFSAASYSPTPAPAPFLSDFSKFQ
jgi:hypothetical protein